MPSQNKHAGLPNRFLTSRQYQRQNLICPPEESQKLQKQLLYRQKQMSYTMATMFRPAVLQSLRLKVLTTRCISRQALTCRGLRPLCATNPSNDVWPGRCRVTISKCFSTVAQTKVESEFHITQDEALCFLEDILQLPEPKTKLDRDPSEFLNQIIRQMYSRIPFTNMGNTKDFNSFEMPTFPEMKEAMFKRQGGHCVNFTGFTYLLLQRLGYDSYICDGSHGDGKSNHSAIVVRDLTVPGSKHLVDTGAGVPLFRAVPLDFNAVSPTYRDDYMTYRFVKRSDGIVVCEKILSRDHYWDFAMDKRNENLVGTWYPFMTYEVDIPRDFQFFIENRKHIYEIQNIPPYFLRTILLISFPKGRLHSITNKALFLSSEKGEIRYKRLTLQDAKSLCLEHYPQFPEDAVEDILLFTQSMALKHNSR